MPPTESRLVELREEWVARVERLEAELERYRLAAGALAKCLRFELPRGSSFAEFAEIWGEGVTAEELDALGAVQDTLGVGK